MKKLFLICLLIPALAYSFTYKNNPQTGKPDLVTTSVADLTDIGTGYVPAATFFNYTGIGRVPNTRTVNGQALTSDVTITTISGNAGTATALAANGSNCSAGEASLGVDASGNAESCWAPMKTDYSNAGTAPTWNQNTTGSAVSLSTPNTVPNAGNFYETGSWTVTAATGFTINSGSPTYTGTFVRIGKEVTATWTMRSGKVTIAAGATVTGLPYSGSASSWGIYGNDGFNTDQHFMVLGSSTLYLSTAGVYDGYLSGSITYITP